MMRYIPNYSEIEIKRNICVRCRGYKRICGRSICPILLKVKSKLEIEKYLTSNSVFGASPPSIFVGSWGYPRVYIGPLTPPIEDRNTSIMDMPNLWLNLDWDTILRYRFILFRGKLR